MRIKFEVTLTTKESCGYSGKAEFLKMWCGMVLRALEDAMRYYSCDIVVTAEEVTGEKP